MKLSLYIDDTSLHRENPKELHTYKMLVLVNRLARLQDTRYRINTQKSIIFLFVSNEELDNEIEKNSSIYKRINYLGISLTEEMQYVYSQNSKFCGKKLKKTK